MHHVGSSVHLKNCLDIILLENKYKFWFKIEVEK